jgi:hypothetical protein
MSISNNWHSSSTASTANYNTCKNSIKFKTEEIKQEVKKIAEEEEEDKQKHLPIFDIKDLDI